MSGPAGVRPKLVEQGVGIEHLHRVAGGLARQGQFGQGEAIAEGVGGKRTVEHAAFYPRRTPEFRDVISRRLFHCVIKAKQI